MFEMIANLLIALISAKLYNSIWLRKNCHVFSVVTFKVSPGFEFFLVTQRNERFAETNGWMLFHTELG